MWSLVRKVLKMFQNTVAVDERNDTGSVHPSSGTDQRSEIQPEPNDKPEEEQDRHPSYPSSSAVRYSGIDFKPDEDSGYGCEYKQGDGYGAEVDRDNDLTNSSSDIESGDWSGSSQGGIGW